MIQLTVATFNTWNCQGRFSPRLRLMGAGLKALGADVVLLQEVFAQAPEGLNVARRLARETNMNYAFVPAREKIRKMDGMPILSQSGLAVLSRWPITNSRAVRLPMDERDGQRIAQVVEVVHEELVWRFGNVHLTHLSDRDDLRRAQLERLASAMGEGGDVRVIGGDMNAPAGHRVFDVLNGYRSSSFVGAPPPSTLNPVNGGKPSLGIIDHLFIATRPECMAKMQVRPALHEPDPRTGHYASDHMAVVGHVAVNGQCQAMSTVS